MFSYREHKIISAVPLEDIKKYLQELGASESPEMKFGYKELEIVVTPFSDDTYPDLGIPRHTIVVNGDLLSAEDFLTNFRFRFMSAGG